MNDVDALGLAHRLMHLLRIGPGAEIELSLLKNGSVLVTKTRENGEADTSEKSGEG